jgi:hypothetical protein
MVGKIIGCTNCFNHEINDYSLGVFSITDTNDSSLAYNIPLSSVGLDTESYSSGNDLVDVPAISFTYRVAQENEIFDLPCISDPMAPPFPYFRHAFLEIIITNYQFIQ